MWRTWWTGPVSAAAGFWLSSWEDRVWWRLRREPLVSAAVRNHKMMNKDLPIHTSIYVFIWNERCTSRNIEENCFFSREKNTVFFDDNSRICSQQRYLKKMQLTTLVHAHHFRMVRIQSNCKHQPAICLVDLNPYYLPRHTDA